MGNYKDVWYQSDDNLRLYARDYENDEAALTLLCLHGLTRNSADFEDLAPQLQDQYRVVVVDQRGRGESDWDENVDNYNPVRYVQDMFRLIDHLALSDIVLIGTSMGGLMSMMMVAMQPEKFKAVVLNDVGPVVARAGLERIKGYVGKGKPVADWAEAIEQTAAVNGVAFPKYEHSDWERWVHRMYRENESGELELRYDPAIAEPIAENDDNAVPADPWPLFDGTTRLPLLVFRGQLSDILEPDCVAEMKHRHSNMTLVTVPDVGHAPMLDEPVVLPALREFLDQIICTEGSSALQ